jgi:hypothetical protein
MASVADLASLYNGTTNPALYTTIQDAFAQKQAEQQLMNQRRQQEIDQSNAKFPLEQALQQTNIDTNRARIPGIEAESRGKVRDDQMSEALYWDKLNDQQKKHMLSASSSDLGLMENHAAKLMQSQDPEEQNQGKALYGLSRGILKMQMQEQAKADLQRQKDEEAYKRAQLAANSKIEAARLHAAATQNGKSRDPKSYEQLGVTYRQKALAEPDNAAYWNTQADNAEQMAAWLKQAGAFKPTPDVAKVTGGAVPTTTPPPKPSMGAPAAQPAAASGRVRVKSPDGKMGSIPAEQLKDALAQGYTEVK